MSRINLKIFCQGAKVQSRHSEPLQTADLRLSERHKQVTARYERIDTVLEGLETDSSHRLHKPLQYGRASDDTTFGVQLFADAILTVS